MAKRRESPRTLTALTQRLNALDTERRAVVAAIRAATTSLIGGSRSKSTRTAARKARPAPNGGAAKPKSATARVTKQKPGNTKPARTRKPVHMKNP